MPLKPNDLKTAFEGAFNHKMERLFEARDYDEYKRANKELANTLVEAIEKYIKGADVDHEVPVDVTTTVSTIVATPNTVTGTGTGAGTGATIPKKKVGKIT